MAVAIALGAVGCGGSGGGGGRAEVAGGTLQEALDRQVARNAEQHGTAGQAVLILRNGKPIYRAAHGLADRATNRPVRADDVFPVYSVAKLFASVLVMQLVERGDLALDRPASQYLPDLPARWRAITVQQLLDHVSGLPDYFGSDASTTVFPASPAEAFRTFGAQPLLAEPGTRVRYNQINYLLLAAILEAHYKAPYLAIVHERIVAPLGLRRTYFGQRQVPAGTAVVSGYRGKDGTLVDDPRVDWPAYAIVHAEVYSTVDDLGAYLNALCEGKLVKRETLLRLWRPHQLPNGDVGWWGAGWEYGRVGDYQAVGHDGGTKVRVRLMYRDALDRDTYAIVYLTNGSADNVWSRTLIDSLMDITLAYEPAPAR